MSLRSAVVAVGDELLLGDVVNANAAYLGAALAAVGAPVVHSSAVGDDVGRIGTALRRALEDAEVVCVTGGLGPTVDDVTRPAVAALAGVPLLRLPALERGLRERFARLGVSMPAEVLRQADVPRGAAVLDNPAGTAPGLRLELGDRLLLALPGPPHELAAVLSAAVLADLAARSGSVLLTRTLHCAGAGESAIAALVDGALDLPPGVTLAYLAADGVVRVRLTTVAPTSSEAGRRLDPLVHGAAEALGDLVFGRDDDTLPGVVRAALRAADQTVAVAESLTGGLVGAALTDGAGSSEVFRGGVQAYATDLKATLAGVPPQLLAEHGAVSSATAVAMAAGVRDRLAASWGLALTGVAGPEPQEGSPPGTLHLAVAGPAGSGARSVQLTGDRHRVRALAVTAALDLLRRRLG